MKKLLLSSLFALSLMFMACSHGGKRNCDMGKCKVTKASCKDGKCDHKKMKCKDGKCDHKKMKKDCCKTDKCKDGKCDHKKMKKDKKMKTEKKS